MHLSLPHRRRIASHLLHSAIAACLALPAAHAGDAPPATALAQPDTRTPPISANAQALARFERGVHAVRQQNTEEAIQIFTDLTRDFPNLPEPYNNLAVLYASAGDLQNAASLLARAVRVAPNYATAYENLGDLYALMASEAYVRAVQIDSMRSSVVPKIALIQQIFPEDKASPMRPAQPRSTGVTALTDTTASPRAQPAAPAASAGAQPSQTQAVTSAIAQAVQRWAAAWSSQQLPDYFAAYSPQFRPASGDLANWKQERRARIEDKGFIQVHISDLKIQSQGNRATATFVQRYTADHHQSTDRKTLQLQREGEQWLITREFTTP